MKLFFLLLLLAINYNSLNDMTYRTGNNHTDKIYTYRILEAGSITPEGWILDQLRHDLLNGYIGSFEEVHPTVTHELFVNQDRKSKRKFSMRKEWWSGEHEGYWKDAVIRMAFLTGEEEFKKRAKEWIDDIVAASADDGYIGIYRKGNKTGTRFNHKRGNGELWATSRIIMAMLAYYEYTGDEEVLHSAENAVQLIIDNYEDENYFAVTSRGGGVSHGIGFFENLEWLYRITGKEVYLDFAEQLYNDFNSTEVRDDDLQTDQLLNEEVLFEKHGAHIAEGLFVPRMIAGIREDDLLEDAADNVLEKLEQQTTPSGAMRCDEWIKGRKGTADERYEYCGITEMVSPLNKMISFTGNMSLADRIETMTFNAGQGARFPVLKALSYLTRDNRIQINRREIAGRETYDAAHFAAVCCVLNGGRLMPYYVEGMWMKEKSNDGLAAILYGPNTLKTTVENVHVTIHEDTYYPFSDTVTFTIDPEKPVRFTLKLRKPHGCNDILLKLPENATKTETDDAVIIDHAWEKGDIVEAVFTFKVVKVHQPSSKSVEGEGIYLKRGPLVFALPFEPEVRPAKEHHNSGFYRYRIRAADKSAWNYRLDEKAPVRVINSDVADMNTPWEKPVIKLEVQLTDSKGDKHKAQLVPMGNTIFRRVTFSVQQ